MTTLLKILDNEVKVYWDGEIVTLVDDGMTITLDPESQIELVEIFEDIVDGKYR